MIWPLGKYHKYVLGNLLDLKFVEYVLTSIYLSRNAPRDCAAA